MNIPNTVNIYDFVACLSKTDLAGVLTACGYAIRESITLKDSLLELGFDVDTSLIQDISDDRKLTLLALYCTTQLSIEA